MRQINKLNPEESELNASYESNQWKPVEGVQSEKGRYQAYAKATFRKDRRVNIRISSKDLLEIQKRAIEEGIPYQTLMASVLHKYISGGLVSKSSYHLSIHDEEIPE
jgi:predicted DNA binding CopG/RHH family protein